MSENQQEQTTPSAEQQPTQQPAPVVPEQPATEPTPPFAGGNGEQVAPGQQPATGPELPVSDETTDAGNGADDQPTAAEEAAAVDVTEPAPPENPHAGGEGEGSAGFGVTEKFIHDEPADDAGTEQ